MPACSLCRVSTCLRSGIASVVSPGSGSGCPFYCFSALTAGVYTVRKQLPKGLFLLLLVSRQIIPSTVVSRSLDMSLVEFQVLMVSVAGFRLLP